MDIPCSLAMTGAEFASAQTLPEHIAWMACHFSPTGEGLSNLPKALPPGSVVMVDDSFPAQGHDPELIASQLTNLVEQQLLAVLLDFQRPSLEENTVITQYLTAHLPCPVCVTPHYAQKLDCPVLLPPPRLHQHLETYLDPWKGREIWLEALLESEQITLTQEESGITELPFFPMVGEHFIDTALCCGYQIQVLDDRAIFTLCRDRDMLKSLLTLAEKQGVRRGVGLYQQLGPEPFL